MVADGKLLAIASTKIYLLDAQTLSQIRSIETRGLPNGLAFSPDGTMLASSAYDASSCASGQWERIAHFFRPHVCQRSRLSSDGSTLAVAAGKTSSCSMCPVEVN